MIWSHKFAWDLYFILLIYRDPYISKLIYSDIQDARILSERPSSFITKIFWSFYSFCWTVCNIFYPKGIRATNLINNYNFFIPILYPFRYLRTKIFSINRIRNVKKSPFFHLFISNYRYQKTHPHLFMNQYFFSSSNPYPLYYFIIFSVLSLDFSSICRLQFYYSW
jgi:hypothetical protein